MGYNEPRERDSDGDAAPRQVGAGWGGEGAKGGRREGHATWSGNGVCQSGFAKCLDVEFAHLVMFMNTSVI